jgi:hypothetical protein
MQVIVADGLSGGTQVARYPDNCNSFHIKVTSLVTPATATGLTASVACPPKVNSQRPPSPMSEVEDPKTIHRFECFPKADM